LQRAIAYHAVIGYINVVRVVRSTLPNNIPDYLGYIYIQVAFKSAIVGRLYWQDLKRDTQR